MEAEMKSKTINRPTPIKEFSFENMYMDIGEAWQRRAKELQARRWKKIHRKEKQLKTGIHG